MLFVVGDMHCVSTAAVQLPAGFRPRLRCRPLRMYVGPLELTAYADSLLASPDGAGAGCQQVHG